MSPGIVRGSLALLPFLLISGEVDAQQRTSKLATFQTSTRIVLVPFSVTDHSGKSVLGLQAGDFHIFDDQTPQQIASFALEDLPCTVGLVLDISGSMQGSLGMLKAAAQQFVKSANPEDDFALLTVSTAPEASSEFTNDAAELEQKIAYIKPGGFTALIDTVYLGLNQMRKAPHAQRALLIVSDGVDNHSRYSKGELLRVALEADVQIYSIIIDNGATLSSSGIPYVPAMAQKPWDQARQRQGPNLLEEIADKTGGLYFHAAKDDTAKEAMAKAGEALRHQYVIGYQPAGSGLSGKWHRIQVKTTVPRVHIHSRSGYYQP
ncbi:MAG: VWA domain-containing protein [Bryobacterales bacterium]|nr:VWA domain-containing protein [Bryobacterales bacterium]MBV9400008.1 VWA domain-containing protein [Bryobacterales bacterium]